MGRDKALVEFQGEPLIARALRSLGEVCTEVGIAGGGAELEAFGPRVMDERPGCGPLGGIVSALAETSWQWNLFMAVDMPFVPKMVWMSLLARAERSNLAGVMARVEEQVQPLCAVYSRRALHILRAEFEAGHWKVADAIAAAGEVEYVDFDEPDWFRNLNTAEDLARATIHLKETHL